jgi:hypothetical protein
VQPLQLSTLHFIRDNIQMPILPASLRSIHCCDLLCFTFLFPDFHPQFHVFSPGTPVCDVFQRLLTEVFLLTCRVLNIGRKAYDNLSVIYSASLVELKFHQSWTYVGLLKFSHRIVILESC